MQFSSLFLKKGIFYDNKTKMDIYADRNRGCFVLFPAKFAPV